MFAISVVAFLLIQAPPGDFLTTYIARLGESDEILDQATIDNLRARFGLDKPLYIQYFKWVSNLIVGDFGMSFEWRQPVSDLVWERMGLTMCLSFATLIFTWAVAFPIGVYSAVSKYFLTAICVSSSQASEIECKTGPCTKVAETRPVNADKRAVITL